MGCLGSNASNASSPNRESDQNAPPKKNSHPEMPADGAHNSAVPPGNFQPRQSPNVPDAPRSPAGAENTNSNGGQQGVPLPGSSAYTAPPVNTGDHALFGMIPSSAPKSTPDLSGRVSTDASDQGMTGPISSLAPPLESLNIPMADGAGNTTSLIGMLADDLPSPKSIESPASLGIPLGLEATKIELPDVLLCSASQTLPDGAGPIVAVDSGAVADQGPRKTMEDVYGWHPTLKLDRPQNCSLALVADGHSGRAVARAACQEFPDMLAEELNDRFSTNVALAMCCAVVRTDRELAKQRARGGSTLTACLVRAGKLWTANLGDSRAVMAHGSRAVSLVGALHRPTNAAEVARVVAAGGEITGEGDDERVGGCLAITRALGDFGLKGGEHNTMTGESTFVVSNLPDVTVVTLTPQCRFVVVGCDGIWDHVKDDDAIAAASKALDDGSSLQDTARVVVDLALKNGSTDNCTALVVKLAPSDNSPPVGNAPIDTTTASCMVGGPPVLN